MSKEVEECGYIGCHEVSVMKVQQTVGNFQILPLCEGHKKSLTWIKNGVVTSRFYKLVE